MGVLADTWSTGSDGPYWDGLGEGRLLIPQCRHCQAWHWPAVWRCAACGSWEQDWQEVAPEGQIYSWTRNWHPFGGLEEIEKPFVIVVVQLGGAGGVRLMGILDDAGPEVRIGDRVTGRFTTTRYGGRDVPALRWRPA